jgi:hypothetical protein
MPSAKIDVSLKEWKVKELRKSINYCVLFLIRSAPKQPGADI